MTSVSFIFTDNYQNKVIYTFIHEHDTFYKWYFLQVFPMYLQTSDFIEKYCSNMLIVHTEVALHQKPVSNLQ